MPKSTFAAFLMGAALFFLSAGAASAQAILLAVQESAGGQALSEPLPVREGVDGSLFESDFVVFDVPGAPPSRDELARIARSSGADVILSITVTWEDVPNTTPSRMSGLASFSALTAANGATVVSGSVDATNKGREKDADRAKLGAEIGAQIALRVKTALAGAASSSH